MFKKIIILISAFLIIGFIFAPISYALETNYPSVPGASQPSDQTSLPDFVKYIFVLLIAGSGIIAIFSLTIAGFRYLNSGGNPEKIKQARGQVLSAFWGIMILLGSWVILNIINPKLTSLELEDPIPVPGVEIPAPPIYSIPTSDLLLRVKLLVEATKKTPDYIKETAKKIKELTDKCDCGNTQSICACEKGGQSSLDKKPWDYSLDNYDTDIFLLSYEKKPIIIPKTFNDSIEPIGAGGETPFGGGGIEPIGAGGETPFGGGIEPIGAGGETPFGGGGIEPIGAGGETPGEPGGEPGGESGGEPEGEPEEGGPDQNLICKPKTCYIGQSSNPCPDKEDIKKYEKALIDQKDMIFYYKNRVYEERNDLTTDIEQFIDKEISWYEEQIQAEEKLEDWGGLKQRKIDFLQERKSWLEQEKKYKQELIQELEQLAQIIEKIGDPSIKIPQLSNQCLINVKTKCQARCKQSNDNGCIDKVKGCEPDSCTGGNPCSTGEIQSEISKIEQISQEIKSKCDQIISTINNIEKEKTPTKTL
ncbi:MAG: hypothetical protein ABH956_00665 [Candidatus Nealsonbacteria bacterium]